MLWQFYFAGRVEEEERGRERKRKEGRKERKMGRKEGRNIKVGVMNTKQKTPERQV